MSFHNNFYYDSITEKYSTDKEYASFLKLVIKVEKSFLLCVKSVGKNLLLLTFSIKYKVIIYGKMEALFMVDKELIAEIKNSVNIVKLLKLFL